MASPVDAAHESIVLASFPTRRAAEHMLASLGREFRHDVRKRRAAALVCTANNDGSLKVTESRVVTAGNLANALARFTVFRAVGFFGIISTLKGGEDEVHALRAREGHVAADEHPAHAILAEAGPKGAVVLVRCNDQAGAERVATRAADSALRHWDASLQDFLDALEPGDQDWMRHALGEPSNTHRQLAAQPAKSSCHAWAEQLVVVSFEELRVRR
jgi:hypothetical protein